MPANTIPAGRSLAFLLVSVLVMDACAGGGSARHNTDSSSASAGGQPAEMRRTYVATAGSEAMGSEWTATVRPLGDGGSAPPRELPGSESIPSSSDAAAPRPIQLSQAQNNPAVASLLSTANSQSQAGDHARAAATLERAIAIEPNNAWLWHYLAAALLREGRLDQAAAVAAIIPHHLRVLPQGLAVLCGLNIRPS